ncbi:MAG: riboflavin biosynthesis protein RibF [Opitutaceae bacterium]|nr:riboflavin biosynthesis protein RibF [Opitutaceae bacterium]
MIEFKSFESLAVLTLPSKAVHLAIGMFDGVHLGHQAVIDTAVQSARRAGALAGVLTFWPHPSAMFRPNERTRMITSAEERIRRLSEAGVDFVVTEPFTPEFAAIEAGEFVSYLKRYLRRLQTIYVGENWRFGKGRTGDVSLLIKLARAQSLSVVSSQRINFNGEPVSSTRIRSCLEAGAIEEANDLLGYPYASCGVVSAGRRIGREIGFPTLNLKWDPDLRPKLGVYAVRATSAGQSRLGVANYGVRPTVESGAEPRLEVHLFEDCPWRAGDALCVEWLKFLRAEQKFAGLDELKGQIALDRANAAAFFAGKNSS